MSLLYKMRQYFAKHIWMRHPMPTFVLDFACADWPWLTIDGIGGNFISGDRFMPNVKSLHFVSDKDPLYPFLKMDQQFENGIVIEFDQGHRPPRTLTLETLKIVADFLAELYEQKNGGDDDSK